MLTSLKIENIAIIESASIEFGTGLNVMTGETGAGKSIIIDSINAILGERTSRDLIRTGTDCAKVNAVFEDISDNLKKELSENGIDVDDDILIINRIINRDGKNICRINGVPVTVSMLKSIGKELINIHGQHDNQALLSPELHCSFVDSYAQDNELISSYQQAYSQLISVRKELKNLTTDETSKAQKIDLLNYQIDEIEKSDIRIGERDELTNRKNLINNSQKVIENLNEAYMALKSDGGAIDCVNSAEGEIGQATVYLYSINETAQKIVDLKYELEDVAEIIRDNLDELDYNPEELDEIEERLDLLYRLSRKYGESEEDILEYLENAKVELNKITFSDERIAQLRVEEEKLLKRAENLAARLTLTRIEAGEALSRAISSELEFLDMPNVEFIVNRIETPLSLNGQDNIEFLISPNAGEDPKPLAKIASGGELSRIMLAIKNVIAGLDEVGTMIFDEIDAGVSGRAAQKIALKLHSVAKGRQVICVTHLAQIAAQGDIHLFISKAVKDAKTYTSIKQLSGEERAMEIARIMGGIEITQLQLESAREMLNQSK